MLDWQEGLPYSSLFGDVYFSADSGLEESRHVFLRGNRLSDRFTALSACASFTIGETGFGTGRNFLCAWQLFEQTAPAEASLDFFSIEKFPLDDNELQAALALWPELQSLAEALQKSWRRRVPGWNRWTFSGGRVRLTLIIDDVENALPQLQPGSVDAWFLDGFSPSRNPEMWCENVLSGIARASRPAATVATYTCAGSVRTGLFKAGFSVEKMPGFGHKREMLCGAIAPFSIAMEKRRTPSSAIVVGGGLAGCAVAHALATRGVSVKLLERAPHLASAASGNPLGILHARFGVSDNPLNHLVLAAYGHALSMLDHVMPIDGVLRSECGLLQLECSPNEHKRILQLAERELPPELFRFVDSRQASTLTGMEMAHGGLWFPAGGWVVPAAFCVRLADNSNIDSRLGHTLEKLVKTHGGWRATGRGKIGEEWIIDSEAVVVCCANSALKLPQFAHFPLTPVRGQITLLPATEISKSLKAVICGDGYCSPAPFGIHVAGATHEFGDESIELRANDHAENLAKLATYSPAVHKALDVMDIESLDGRASVRCSAPGSIPFVGKVQAGLYCSLAHGTRGLLTAGLAGETIAAMICGQLAPLPENILTSISPLTRAGRQVSSTT